MIHADLHEPGTYETWLSHPVWRTCLDWLRTLRPDAPLGRHELQGDDIFASVQEYGTLPREEARFESHRERIDLQYTLAGAEAIDWHPAGGLTPDGGFADDVQFWLPPEGAIATVVNSPGRFAIFLPADAHRPKVRAGVPSVRKLVIKIRASLLA